MKTVSMDGVTLAYTDTLTARPAMLFVHGWACDHTCWSAQEAFFSSFYRVVSVDLRGHGESYDPGNDYSVDRFVKDLAWFCEYVSLSRPILVGHGMGGTISLELSARYPDLPLAVVLIQSVIFPPQAWIRQQLRAFEEEVRSGDYVAAVRAFVSDGSFSYDDPTQTQERLSLLPRAPRHVLLATLRQHLCDYDGALAAMGCRVPTAYIAGTHAVADWIISGLSPRNWWWVS